MSDEKKIRKMGQRNLASGAFKEEMVNVPSTLKQYIAAINMLNESAHVYGVVYVPRDADYDAMMKTETDL